MIINLLTKTFLLDKQNISKDIKTDIHPGYKFTGQKYPYENLASITTPENTLEAIATRIRRYREGSFYFISEDSNNIYGYWLPIYLYCLGFSLKRDIISIFRALVDHDALFKEELDNVFSIDVKTETKFPYIRENSTMTYKVVRHFLERYGDGEITFKDVIKEIPAEFFINMVGKNSIADEKFNYFRLYDIAAAYLKVRQYIFNSNQENNPVAKRVTNIFDSNNKLWFADFIIKFPELEDELKDLFREFDFNEYIPLFTKDMKIYIDLNTRMGYSAMGLFKYNKYLASYLKKINYEIPTKLGYKK